MEALLPFCTISSSLTTFRFLNLRVIFCCRFSGFGSIVTAIIMVSSILNRTQEQNACYWSYSKFLLKRQEPFDHRLIRKWLKATTTTTTRKQYRSFSLSRYNKNESKTLHWIRPRNCDPIGNKWRIKTLLQVLDLCVFPDCRLSKCFPEIFRAQYDCKRHVLAALWCTNMVAGK